MTPENSTAAAIEARAADWIAERDHAGADWSPERRQTFDAWLAANTSHRVAWLRLDQTWRRVDRLSAFQPPALSPKLATRRWGWMPRRAAFAGLGLALLLGVASLRVWQGDGAEQRFATELGRRETVKLADGSQLTLNTATMLRTEVTPKQREVWLERGEAFFEIAHDPAHPFVVHAGRQTVTVLGTKFSLLRDGESLRVAVLEGRVQVQSDASRPAVLVRDDTALVDERNVLVRRQSSQQVAATLSWLQGKLVFDQVSLAEAARQFNRYNHRQLQIDDAAAAAINIGGVFDADNVEAFARLLHAGFGLEVQIGDGVIRIASPAQTMPAS